MADVVLSDKLLTGLAGWDVVKQARAMVAENRVLSSHWQPPVLRGVVQSGNTSYRAGLVIKRENDAENLCTCRQSREWGTLCPHSIAVGLHALRPVGPTDPGTGTGHASAPSSSRTGPSSPRPAAPRRDARRLQRSSEPGGGQPLAVHIILPPNFAEGLARGRATVFFEGRWPRGTTALASLPRDQTFQVDPLDARLLDAIELLAGGDTPAMLQLGTADFAGLLEALVDHPRVTLGKGQAVVISGRPWRVPLRATLQPTGDITLQLRGLSRPPTLIPGARCWAVLGGAGIQPLGLPPACQGVISSPQRWARPQVPEFVGVLLPLLARDTDLEANFVPSDFELSPRPPSFHLHLAGGLAGLTAQLQAAYGPRVMTVGTTAASEAVWMPDPDHPRRYATRDVSAERSALQRLLQHGFQGPDAQGRYQLHGQNQVLNFFAREYPRLEKEWQVTLEERLEHSTQKHLERVEPRLAITPSGEQWFDLAVAFRSPAGTTLPTPEILRLVRGGQSHTRLKNGKFALIDTGAVEELEEILVDCAPQQHAGGYRMAQSQAGFLNATLQQQGWEAVAPSGWRERALQQSGEVDLACPPLGPLEEVLRPYQKQGVAWLAFLRRSGFGGVLADEMGLGKTLQTLAHLDAALRTPNSELRTPSLVVCPTSLVPNWAAEAARFTPGLRVLVLHGAGRHRDFARIPESDLVITSYALVRRDLPRYRALSFDTVILDEAQHIKNRQTQNAQAVKAVPARHRLVLTGTPLENSVLDLWSIFDFLMPGYLGSAKDFRERYEIPIVREKCAATQARLARRVRPFLFRRLKRQVAPELPPRIDQVVWCELNPQQASVYAQLLDATRREVDAAVGAQGLAKSRLLVLTALLRLRQACCDLRLLGVQGEEAEDEKDTAVPSEASGPSNHPTAATSSPASPSDSGKLDAFAELLEEVLDGGHRVLVFSQFTRMLALLRERLDAEAVPYAYLDGSTRDRAAVVSSFQESADLPVFLISLKAGGVGLNLTAADTVVHFDPWWNPAVEDQATDRAHRIGQDRVVTSYKLITRGTVEEKILRLQERKREVTSGLLTGEEQLTESLSWEEIQNLLA